MNIRFYTPKQHGRNFEGRQLHPKQNKFSVDSNLLVTPPSYEGNRIAGFSSPVKYGPATLTFE
jgi:hypothetical protein